ncbi:MAG: CHASE sensor domain-containing protein, partial [Pseudomonadota bacterium]|nr:CHASE sensor domain-containing protein [Pseudomonadota bacterium]
MFNYRQMSIRTKLLLITVGTTFVTLVAVMSIMNIGGYLFTKKEIEKRITVISDITAQSLISSLDFIDKAAALENLQSLTFESSIKYACVYDLANSLFAEYTREAGQASCKQSLLNSSAVDGFTHIVVISPIMRFSEERVGDLLIHYDLSAFNKSWMLDVLFNAG